MTSRAIYQAVRIEGGILPADFLARVADLGADHQTNTDYGLTRSLSLRDEISRNFRMARDLLGARQFVERLLRDVLDFMDLERRGEATWIGERAFPITHFAHDGHVPILAVDAETDLDRGDTRFGQDGRRRSPHNTMQEYLNAETACLWGIVTNGRLIRVLRDNPSLTRPAYIEADLTQILTDNLYADFTAFWLVFHATRFAPGSRGVEDAILEHWRSRGHEEGQRALKKLRAGVTQALRELGSGFLAHPDNRELRAAFDRGELDGSGYFQELLRVVYRVLFLYTAEDRDLLHDPEAGDDACEIYRRGYGFGRLRERAGRRIESDRHDDLWQSARIVFDALGRGEPALGLPALGGLFRAGTCPHLEGCALANERFLKAIQALTYFRGDAGLTRVNFRDMGTEELGSVYESLLELHPMVDVSTQPWRFKFANDDAEGGVAGSERKLTGSYYTPTVLVEEILNSTLDPVIARTVRDNPSDPVSALKRLRIVDPAAGSGHFILAAARRVAAEIARIMADQDTPEETVRRHALREVVGNCIYGVDKNPLAVELCKAALWIEAMEPGKPLTFLDGHIRCGDSLVGVFDPAVLENGIPDGAFKQIADDEKSACDDLRKRNRDARKSKSGSVQESLDLETAGGAAETGSVEAALRDVDAMPEDTLEQVEAKARAYEDVRQKPELHQELLRANLFTGAFFAKKTANTMKRVPTTEHLNRLRRGFPLSEHVQAEADRLAKRYNFFHWYLEFPDVFADGGFDVTVGNPPWERIKLQEQEFFASRSPEIANAQNANARKKAIEKLFREDASPAEKELAQAFRAAQREADGASLFVHNSGRYPLTGKGDVNTYALFTEVFHILRASVGYSGCIIPTGIATDGNNQQFFRNLMARGELLSIYDFRNTGFFQDSAGAQGNRFCLFTMASKSDPEHPSRFAFRLGTIRDLYDERRHCLLTQNDIALINPNTNTCPIFRSRADAELTKKIYRRVPVLVDENKGEEGNPWGVSFGTMFHMSNDSGLFRTAGDLREASAERDVNRWIEPDGTVWLPLYEAKMIHQYNHRFGDYRTMDLQSGRGVRQLKRPEVSELMNTEYEPQPRYWVNAENVQKRLDKKEWKHHWLMGWREITSGLDERTVIASFIPKAGCGNKLVLVMPSISPNWAALLLACMNSIVFDYIARQKLGGTSLNVYIMKQIACPIPSFFSQKQRYHLLDNVLRLSCTSFSLTSLASDVGFDDSPFVFDSEYRHLLMAEIDAIMLYAYGLAIDEIRYILDPKDVMSDDYPSETFRILQRNEIERYGEYRTRRLILEAWDRFWADGTFTEREGVENVLPSAA